MATNRLCRCIEYLLCFFRFLFLSPLGVSVCVHVCTWVDFPTMGILSLNLFALPGTSGGADAFKMVLVQVWFFVYGNWDQKPGTQGAPRDTALSSSVQGR